MKQLYYVFLLLLGLALRPTGAQAQTTDSLSQKLTSIFANVDKSQVPTRYLYEAGVRFCRSPTTTAPFPTPTARI